jgi:hypothetical protein
MTINQLNKIKGLLSWISYYWFPNVADSKTIIDTWINQVASWHTKSGTLWTIQRIKDLRLIYTKYIAGEPFKVFPGRIGLNSKGLPKATPYFNSLIENKERRNISFVLTLLSISRAIPGTKDPSTSTITNASTKDNLIIAELTAYIPEFLSENGIKGNREISWTPNKLRLSNKAGPEGRATLFSWRDAVVLPDSLVDNIKDISPTLHSYLLETRQRWPQDIVKKAHQRLKHNFKTFQSIINKDAIAAKAKDVWARVTKIGYDDSVKLYNQKYKDSNKIRKLSIIEDPEAKARVIAIFDYWSQEALKGVHDIQFEILRNNLSQDRTFTQDPIISNKEENESYHSIDLTAATDRFPIEIQTNLIESLFNRDFARSWKSILVDHEFYVPWNDTVVKYNCGQPMGAYSSWSTFAICHHLVVAYAAKLNNIKNFKQYILLGDDIVIYNNAVAESYKMIMQRLGVDTSPHKTHTSKTTYEFAKRWFQEGQEITGIQLRGLLDSMNKYHLLYQMIYTLYSRGQHSMRAVTKVDLILSLYKRMGTYSRMRSSLKVKLLQMDAFRRYIDHNDTSTIVNVIKMKYTSDYVLPVYNERELENLILTYIYQSADKLIQKGTAEAINYESGLFTGPYFNKIAEAFANPYDLWTSPTYLIIVSPLAKAISNRLKVLAESLRVIESGSVKDMIQVISLPDPSMLEARTSERLISSEAALAARFFDTIEDFTKGRPTFYQENLSSTVASMAHTAIEQKIMNSKKYLNHGLI